MHGRGLMVSRLDKQGACKKNVETLESDSKRDVKCKKRCRSEPVAVAFKVIQGH